MDIPYFIKIFSFPLLAVCIAGSAARPVCSGLTRNAGAQAPSAQPARVIFRPSGQRDRQSKNGHPERRRIAVRCSRIAQGGRRSACRQSRSNRCRADSVCVRGPSQQNAAPCEHVADARKQSASSVPFILGGVTGHSPVRRGSARRAAASAQGKAFPTRIRYSALG